VELGRHREGRDVQAAAQTAEAVILLDTNALLWMLSGHRRARPLTRLPRLYISPASLLEVQMLIEIGRGRLVRGKSVSDIARDPRWVQDEPPAGDWFEVATDVSWTRDPFDRLIVAHARVRRWKLATGDSALAEHLSPRELMIV
jgi:PIN domain nuclease of toxin-antitoxin system